MSVMSFFFFFSSRRRHTRLVSDWSSDVCSSDRRKGDRFVDRLCQTETVLFGELDADVAGRFLVGVERNEPQVGPDAAVLAKIGRASCRERVESSVGGGGVE